MTRFEISATDFLLDGAPHRVLSGAIHYFRVHPDDWSDRIRSARMMGLNTVETYVAWNEHAPRRGEFDLTGRLDLGRFLDAIAAEGMHAIVRPGPYMCAEFDNGGLPAWLTRTPDIALRGSDPAYLDAVLEYIEQLAPVLVPRQIDAGGPIVLVQIENEYGAYGHDSEYLRTLMRATRASGIVTPLTTIDQPTDAMLTAGGIPELHRTGSFGSNASARLETLRRHQPTGPLMCAEFWDGWFDSWGGHHHTTSATESARELEVLLAAGASVNLYMFHGGTNFGLTNGANHKGRYVPIATSYDYDAPLDEAGRPTEKFWAFRDVIARFAPVPPVEQPSVPPAPTPSVHVIVRAQLAAVQDQLGSPLMFDEPPAFDDIAHDRGIAVYTTRLSGEGSGALRFEGIRDRAWISLDGIRIGVLSRENHERTIELSRGSGVLEVMVEDQGRVNYGPRIGERKGIIGPVTFNGTELRNWSITPLDLARVPQLGLLHSDGAGSQLVHSDFELAEESALFLDVSRAGKGFAWVNGLLLGRYWRRGPQQTLYVPKGATRAGRNRLIVLELEASETAAWTFVPGPNLGPDEE